MAPGTLYRLPEGSPNAAGLNTDDPAEVRKAAEIAIANGYQLCVHAIGDRANRETLEYSNPPFGPIPTEQTALANRTRTAHQCRWTYPGSASLA